MILISTPGNFSSHKDRKWLAGILSKIIDPFSQDRFEPYLSNAGDTTNWILDSMNDWRVHFFEEDKTKFRITYRYHNDRSTKESNLCVWLKELRLCDYYEPTNPKPTAN